MIEWVCITALAVLVVLQFVGSGMHHRRIEALEREIIRLKVKS